MNDLFAALSGAVAQERKLDTITNNLANANTSGYRKDDVAFKAALANFTHTEEWDSQTQGIKNAQEPEPNPLLVFTEHTRNYVDLTPGQIRQTDNPLDIAIAEHDPELQGRAFFALESDEGIRLTRSSNFGISQDASGNSMLVSMGSGLPVLGQGDAPISIKSENIHISETGDIYDGGAKVGTLKVVSIPDQTSLRKIGENLLTWEGDSKGVTELTAGSQFSIKQGFEEASNVNVVDEMVRMIRVQRAFDASIKAMQTSDQTTEALISGAMRS